MPRAPRAELTTVAGIKIPAPLLDIVAKIQKVNPGMFEPFAAIMSVDRVRGVPTAIDLNPPKALKVLATKDRPKPKQDLLAISKRKNQIRAAKLRPTASIFKAKSFSEKSRFTRSAEPTKEPATVPMKEPTAVRVPTREASDTGKKKKGDT